MHQWFLFLCKAAAFKDRAPLVQSPWQVELLVSEKRCVETVFIPAEDGDTSLCQPLDLSAQPDCCNDLFCIRRYKCSFIVFVVF